MASAKFNKGSEEWLMFMDFWNLCQKHWQVENKDKYWEQLTNDANEFYEKYKEITLCRKLTMAFVDTQEVVYKEKYKGAE
jgi:hypothetical protein